VREIAKADTRSKRKSSFRVALRLPGIQDYQEFLDPGFRRDDRSNVKNRWGHYTRIPEGRLISSYFFAEALQIV
jgi:hypothetical protein